MSENPTSYKNMTVYCPYCGCLNTEEHLLMQLYKDAVWFLECRGCGKEVTLILYDTSEQTIPDMNDEAVRELVEQGHKNRTDVVNSSQLGFEVPEK